MEKVDIALQIIKAMPALVEQIHKLHLELKADLSSNAQLCAHETVLASKALGKCLNDGQSAWDSRNLIPRIAATSLMAFSAIQAMKPVCAAQSARWASAKLNETFSIVEFIPCVSFEGALVNASRVNDDLRRQAARDDNGEYWTTDSDGWVIEILAEVPASYFDHLIPDITRAVLNGIESEMKYIYPSRNQLESTALAFASASEKVIQASMEDLLGEMVMTAFQMAIPNPIYMLGRSFKASNIGNRIGNFSLELGGPPRAKFFSIDTGKPIQTNQVTIESQEPPKI